MFGLGIFEIIIILFVALLFIGPKKLPEVAKNLGKGLRDFQNAVKGISDPNNYQPPVDEPDGSHDDDPDGRHEETVITTTATQADEDKKES